MNRLRLGLLVSMVALEGLVLGRGALPDGAILPAGQGVLVDIPVDADLLPLIGVLAKVTHDHGIHDVIKGSIMVHGTDYPFAYDGLLTSAQLQAMPGLGEGASVAICAQPGPGGAQREARLKSSHARESMRPA